MRTSYTPLTPQSARGPMPTIDVDPAWLIEGSPDATPPPSSRVSSARAPLSTIVVEDVWLDEEEPTARRNVPKLER